MRPFPTRLGQTVPVRVEKRPVLALPCHCRNRTFSKAGGRPLRARAGHCGPPLSFSTADVPSSSEPHDKLAIMTHINRAEFENAAFEVNLGRAIGLQADGTFSGGMVSAT